ncbi:hypothetical protein [Streptomyces sp. SAJ15]|uniref:NucA/NucB deoxyribonuclease domain-containing protein n=1 Tax=Streptomyces sp. SAJ15 TaxID=2011095 RepID=UPI001186523C|nr:hypothetical protein [Streptomyces sp. SAJ15]
MENDHLIHAGYLWAFSVLRSAAWGRVNGWNPEAGPVSAGRVRSLSPPTPAGQPAGDAACGCRISKRVPESSRKDAELSGYGCVIGQIRALLDMPLSRYGEAAATYWFGQAALVDQWGTPGNPLSRNKDEGAAKANRYRTCEEGTSIPFYPQDDIQDDSCDEYPFAGTFEGGTDGGQCA